MLIKSISPKETAVIAKKLGKVVQKDRRGAKNALVIGLSGDLGAGKTEFVKSFMKGVGIRSRITSPTFLLSRRYPRAAGAPGSVFHVDAYRVGSVNEMEHTGLNEAIRNPKNIVLVEWGERIKPLLPKDTAWIKFRHGAHPNERLITFRKTARIPEFAPNPRINADQPNARIATPVPTKGWDDTSRTNI